MNMSNRCPECGAARQAERTCQDDFHEMLVWESEHPEFAREVHHLTVLSYYLQHPSLYSLEGLRGAQQLLVDMLERGLSPGDVRRRDRAKVDSGKRTYKIAGTPASHATYTYPVHWPLTAADVIAAGPAAYCDSVRAWSRSVLQALNTSSNLGPDQT